MSLRALLGRLWPRPYIRRERCEVLVIRLPGDAQPEDSYCVRDELNRLAPDHWLGLNPRLFQVTCLSANDGAARIAAIRDNLDAQCGARDTMRGTRFGRSSGDCTVSFDPRGRLSGPVLGPATMEAMNHAR